MSFLIDSHCHLHYDYAPKSIDTLIHEASAQGIGAMITVGTDLASFPVIQALAEKHPTVFFSVGVHPHDTENLVDEDIRSLAQFSGHPKCVAIGEIGLDYYYEHSKREVQIHQLVQQLDYARECQLPVIIHSREAEADLLPHLATYAKNCSLPSPGVIHCFSGTEEFGRACIDLGFKISFSGILTFKTATVLQECARKFPLASLLVETDAPYLAPIPFRGKKCEPAMVRQTALKLAELQGISLEAVIAATYQNTLDLFRLKLPTL